VKVSEAMTRDVLVANPDQSIREAAQMVVDLDAGALPVARRTGRSTRRDGQNA
jgi:CBS domain-containing protein